MEFIVVATRVIALWLGQQKYYFGCYLKQMQGIN